MMPILQIQSVHNPPLRLLSSSACRSSVRSMRDLGAKRGGVILAGALSRTIVTTISVQPERWAPTRSGGFSQRKAVAGVSDCPARWCGLRSETRKSHNSCFEEVIYRKMAASVVASPVLLKLDSIPKDVPVVIVASESSRADVKRNNRLVVVGHRGCGKNNALSIGDIPGTRLSVRENTITSFNLAASNGADYVEFDVQVTKDGHPVIFHDDLILSESEASRIRDLTVEEFLAFGPQKDGKVGKSMVRKQKDGTVKAWSSTVEDSLCTLKDAFESVQPSMGFNIEVKFHDTDETSEHELRRSISAILADVEKYAKGRVIYFSSFHPDGAIILRQEQRTYPVFMLTEGGEHLYADPRRNSVEAAINVCLRHGLQGVVSEVLAILKKPQLAAQVKNAGLSLFTYGDMNNVAEALVQQYTANVDGVIVDCVREIVTASRTLHALINFVQPDWSQFLHPSARDTPPVQQ